MISAEQFKQRRQDLIQQLSPNSIAIVASSSEVTRSNDTEFPFRQNSDFFYLTGFNEPEALLLLSNVNGDTCTLFLRDSDKLAEIWHGRRLGVERACDALNIDEAHDIAKIDKLLPSMIDGVSNLYLPPNLMSDGQSHVQQAIEVCRRAPKQSMHAPSVLIDINPLIHQMRLIKTHDELALMQQSADISSQAHVNAMKLCRPGVYEYQLEAEILHTFAMNGARYPAYNSIVGGGNNACILHYTENSDELKDGDLVLIDAGSELEGYAADITRTFPVNGQFNQAQAELYNLVLKAQLECIDILVANNTITQASDKAIEILTQGLIDLGILKGTLSQCIEEKTYRQFYMHGLGHYLGLDVHDVGVYKVDGKDIKLQAGMVMTVEPGLYIDETADVPEQYRGMGIRIEDDIVITESGNTVLTDKVPKTIKEIEALMATHEQ